MLDPSPRSPALSSRLLAAALVLSVVGVVLVALWLDGPAAAPDVVTRPDAGTVAEPLLPPSPDDTAAGALPEAAAEPLSLAPAPPAAPEPTGLPPRLGRVGTLTGQLLDGQGRPIPGEPVDLLAEQDPWQGPRPRDAVHDVVDRCLSDGEGRFRLAAIPGARHALLVGGLAHPRRRLEPVAAGDDLRLELSVGLSLSGRVVAADTGLPVAGARVGAHSGDDRLFTRADAEGRFTLAPLRDGLLVLTGYHPGYDVALSEPLAPGWSDVLLELAPGGRLSGRVDDGASGEPVPGARVTLRLLTATRPMGQVDPLEGRRLVVDQTAVTDDAGHYVLEGVPSRAFRVLVEKPGYRPTVSDRYFGRGPDLEQELVLGLVPAADLSGTVREGEDPAAGIELVLLGDERPLAQALSDADGHFALATDDWDGMAALSVQATGPDGACARQRLEPDDLDAPLELSLARSLTLTVRVLRDDAPCPDAEVLAWTAGARPTIERSDAQGLVRLEHRPARPDAGPVWLQARQGRLLSLAEPVDPDEPRPAGEPLELVLDGGPFCGGVVLDTAGRPLAGARLTTSRGRFGTSDPMGRFRLGPLPLGEAGTLTLQARADGHRPLTLEGLLPRDDLVLELEPVRTWPLVLLEADSGEPAEGLRVQLQQADREGGWTDVEARVRRDTRPGGVRVELPGAGRFRAVVHSGEYLTEEGPALDHDGISEPWPTELFLSRAAVLTVRVEDQRGTPVPGYRVWVVPLERAGDRDTPAGVSGAGLQQRLTDRQGQVRFNLGPGLTCRLASGPGAWLDDGAFTVRPGGRVERVVRLPGLGQLELRVRDEQGRPVGDLRVELEASGQDRVHTVRRAGTVEQALELIPVRDLPAGAYSLGLEREGYRPAAVEVRVEAGRTARASVVLIPEHVGGDG